MLRSSRVSSSSLLAFLLHLLCLSRNAAVVGASSILFSGGTVIAFDEATESLEIISPGSVLVTDDRIAAISSGHAYEPVPEDTETIDITGKIITTGFVDTHHHGWQTAYKTLLSNVTLAQYFARYGEYVPAVHQNFGPEDIYIGQLAGLYEGLNAGVTTTLDHAHHTFSVETSEAGLQASIDSGARVFWCYAIHNISNGFSLKDQIANYQSIATDPRFKSNTTSLGVGYDTFNSPDTETTRDVIALTRDYNASVISTHFLLGPWGFANSPELLLSLGVLEGTIPVVFAHASFITGTGAQVLRQTNHYISIVIESEQHYGHGQPSGQLIQDQASLGIDTHSTFSTDLLTQARMWLQHVRFHFYEQVLENWQVPRNSPMSVHQAFLMATRHGGLALRRRDIGVLAVGAKADLLVWSGDSPNMLGWSDPVAAVILHANIGDIEHVLVDGRFRKRDGKLVDADYPAVKQRFLASAKRIQRMWNEMPLPELEGQFLSGFDYGNTLTVDTLRGPGNGYGEPTFV